ncbi:hypothetical protein EMIHUDRAFT_206802 [Emiliania huxleyi CCMP1516]|uniref:BRCT domain-containing protein n=2 Tax=Emiliania huxleyi TaxID=2903 RepID=A0A0D3JMH5_EMIH1|nr:hypothetical protein EMIHUDRAFT_206802 [Emiliania huxleyi CCMP1516]EOD24710.1 hypothetical protein EMIHUDRAFT_206802 [Emiliania huxleyi CCMP1516]|eukprot:XP_005777139.1 hypothetical protein EMIHUDRAFT_206802 [Emiliania huxleyi CCMP1516]
MSKLIVCTSGLEPDRKRDLQRHTPTLNIEVVPDLTPECTHLVADTVLSEKYLAAVTWRIPVVSYEWVEASLTNGEPIDEEEYLLRPLHRLVICLSGLSFSTADRHSIEALVQREGGAYSASLDRHCTHLVTDSASGDKYMKCCAESTLQHVRIVTPAWLADSIARGACANGNDFAVRAPPPSSGMRAAAPAPLDAVFGPRLCAQAVPQLFLSDCVLHFPESASAAPLLVCLRRLARGCGVTVAEHPSGWVTHIVLGDTAGSDAAVWTELQATCPLAKLVSHVWLTEKHALTGTHNFLRDSLLLWVHPHATPPADAVNERRLLERAQECGAIVVEMSALPLEWAPFTGARAYAVASHGAECAPLAAQAVAARPLDSAAHRTRAASWDWLEQSLQQRRVLSVSEHPLLKPLEARLPLPGFRELKMSLTGFEAESAGRELTARLVSLLGAKVQEKFKRSSTHLVAAGEWGGDKCKRAAELRTPVVPVSWLLECVNRGTCVGTSPFEVLPPAGGAMAHDATVSCGAGRGFGEKEEEAMRVDREDGGAYPRSSFLEVYGDREGARRWMDAAPVAGGDVAAASARAPHFAAVTPSASSAFGSSSSAAASARRTSLGGATPRGAPTPASHGGGGGRRSSAMSSDKRRRRQNPPAQSPRVYCGILQPPQPGDASAASTAAALAEAAPPVAPLPNSDEGSLCTPGDAAATEPLDHKAPSSSSKGSSSSSKRRSPAAAMGDGGQCGGAFAAASGLRPRFARCMHTRAGHRLVHAAAAAVAWALQAGRRSTGRSSTS